MAEVNVAATSIAVQVRYFAAARAAAGLDDEVLTVPVGTTLAALAGELAARNAELARVVPEVFLPLRRFGGENKAVDAAIGPNRRCVTAIRRWVNVIYVTFQDVHGLATALATVRSQLRKRQLDLGFSSFLSV